MIISPGRNYIFVHIPKTGGTALAQALEGRAMRDDLLIGDTPKARRRRARLQGVDTAGRLWKHSTLGDIDGLVSRAFVAGAFVVTLVRNPWDRMVSYYHWLRVQGFDHPAVHLARSVDFNGFLAAPLIGASITSNPYGSYTRDAAGQERCDLYIRIEHFAADAAPLWDHLGFQLNLPVVNRSERRRDYRSYYGQEQAARVAEMCSEDVTRFGYSF
ncbi:sulfotransferase family 2 domain-containing protein [Rhodobacteraceae bacterium KMM 6894]|nr:sulfotransferase family 2 domain-containing protein [Rhodobacteraceae bacterium KMM 6894]